MSHIETPLEYAERIVWKGKKRNPARGDLVLETTIAEAYEAGQVSALALIMNSLCPVHGSSCGTISDPSAILVNNKPARHIEVACAYKINELLLRKGA